MWAMAEVTTQRELMDLAPEQTFPRGTLITVSNKQRLFGALSKARLLSGVQ
jgi:hypothetical protein